MLKHCKRPCRITKKAAKQAAFLFRLIRFSFSSVTYSVLYLISKGYANAGIHIAVVVG